MVLVWDLNKAGTFGVVEYCRQHGSKLVYAGSSTKFADGGMGRDQSPYAWTKATNTELAINWFGLEIAITYFYNVYGQREITCGEYATVLGIFRSQFEAGEPLTVVSPGTQRRNFTHVDDIVRGLIPDAQITTGDQAVHHIYRVDNSRMLADIGYEMAPLRVRILEHINDARREAGMGPLNG